MMIDGFAFPAVIKSRSLRLYALTFAWPVPMFWPLIQKLPKSKAIWPFLAITFEASGSFGRKTPTTPFPPVALTDFTRLFIDRKSGVEGKSAGFGGRRV